MSKKDKDNKKTIFIVFGVVVLLILLFLLWFFNRKFNVTFDLNNGSNDIVLKVKYNNVINEKDIKTSKELGDKFINWYEIIEIKDNQEILDENPFDFTTKIKKAYNLKAVYQGEIEKVTVTFDSNGGSKVSSITLEKGKALTLPKNPTNKGYTFNGWTTKDGKAFKNKTTVNEDITLYAKWDKETTTTKKTTTTTTKKITTNKTTTTTTKKITTTTKAPESMSLSVDHKTINRNGYRTAQITANVKNTTAKPTFTLKSNNICVSLDSKTGVLTALNTNSCDKYSIITVEAKLPSGLSKTIDIFKEADLILSYGNEKFTSNDTVSDIPTNKNYVINSNINVSWTVGCAYEKNCSYVGPVKKTRKSFEGNFQIKAGNSSEKDGAVRLTAKTAGGQSIYLNLNRKVN